MSIEGLLMTGILLLGSLALLGPLAQRRESPQVQEHGLPDNRDLISARNQHARRRFSRSWPVERRSQFQ